MIDAQLQQQLTKVVKDFVSPAVPLAKEYWRLKEKYVLLEEELEKLNCSGIEILKSLRFAPRYFRLTNNIRTEMAQIEKIERAFFQLLNDIKVTLLLQNTSKILGRRRYSEVSSKVRISGILTLSINL